MNSQLSTFFLATGYHQFRVILQSTSIIDNQAKNFGFAFNFERFISQCEDRSRQSIVVHVHYFRFGLVYLNSPCPAPFFDNGEVPL